MRAGPGAEANVCGLAAGERDHRRTAILYAPSVAAGDAEGLPIVVLEEQAMGTPVVTSIGAGIPEVVENRVTGLLAPERD